MDMDAYFTHYRALTIDQLRGRHRWFLEHAQGRPLSVFIGGLRKDLRNIRRNVRKTDPFATERRARIEAYETILAEMTGGAQ